MAIFSIAYRKTISFEGLYSNDVADSGGETVLGLTRVADKDWNGWKLIDERKKMPNFPKNLNEIKEDIDLLAQPYYKKKYWTPIRGDEMKNQNIANSIYDNGVNVGVKQAIILAQRAASIKETGIMDDNTLNALNN